MLTLRAQAELAGEVDEPTPLDYVEHWLSNGESFIALAAALQTDSAKESRGAFEPVLQGGAIGRMLRKQFGEAATDQVVVRARARGAMAQVEQTHVIADEVVLSTEDAARARNRIGTRQWAAERLDRSLAVNKGGVNVQINMGVAHLDALRRRVIPQPQVRLLDEQTETTVEVEVIEQAEQLSVLPATT